MSHSPGAHRSENDVRFATAASLDSAFDAVANRRRREILSVLQEHGGPVSLSDLATTLVDQVEDELHPEANDTTVGAHRSENDDAHENETHEAVVRLHHVHLPKLASAGLIRRDEGQRPALAVNHPFFDDPTFNDIVGRNDGPAVPGAEDVESADAVLSALADERRRTVLSVLLDADEGRLDLSEVAERVAEREHSAVEADVTHVETGLYHVHAPTLADAGLVEYDRDERTLAPNVPDRVEEWLDVALELER